MEVSAALYHPRHNAVAGVLEGLGVHASTPPELIAAVKRGLPTGAFSALAAELEISEAVLAGVTGISPSTLLRRKKAGRLSAEESEHMVRVATLLDTAARLFGGVAAGADWMRSDNAALAGASPLVFADTEIGAREVESLLGRVEFGVYS
jgi:putative toxin-antitoxin system antitoxin component (TIGR02293 family)